MYAFYAFLLLICLVIGASAVNLGWWGKDIFFSLTMVSFVIIFYSPPHKNVVVQSHLLMGNRPRERSNAARFMSCLATRLKPESVVAQVLRSSHGGPLSARLGWGQRGITFNTGRVRGRVRQNAPRSRVGRWDGGGAALRSSGREDPPASLILGGLLHFHQTTFLIAWFTYLISDLLIYFAAF